MGSSFAARTFGVAYCVCYVVALALDAPAFLYFPVKGRVELGPVASTTAEVSMAWYGLVVTAAVFALAFTALAVAAFGRSRRADAAMAVALAFVPALAMAACTVLMRHFFA